ncbi:hypothetical protein EPUL_006479, partial [Erysiphe pulchra]
MPFDFAAYKKKCDGFTTEELQVEWENYTRQLVGGATLTASSILLSPMTSGISLIGTVISVPQLANARKKRAIVGNKMYSYGVVPHTRKRDLLVPAGIALTTAGLTYGMTPIGAELLGGEPGVRGIEYIVTHATLDTMFAILDEAQNTFHHKRSKHKLKKMQDKQKQFLGKDFVKHDEHSRSNLDIKRPHLLEDKHPQPSRRALRAYHIDEDDHYYDRDHTPPPAYSKKYVYHGGQVQYSYDARPGRGKVNLSYDNRPKSSHPPSYNQHPRVSNRRRNYSSSGPAVENLGHLRSSASFRRSSLHENSRPSSLHEHSRPSISRSTNSHYSRNNPSPRYRSVENSEDECYTDSEDEISDEEKVDEEYESDKDEKKKDGKVIEQVLTLEQEVAFLKATILRMEMEKRGLTDSESEKSR